MNMANRGETIHTQQPPIFGQIVAIALGLLFAFTGGYSGLQLVGAIVGAPLLFAGAFRLYIGIYRMVSSLIPIMLLAAVLGLSGIGLITSFVLLPAFKHSALLGGVITGLLMLCEVAVFIRDIRICKKN